MMEKPSPCADILTAQDIDEFRAIWRQEFGIDLSLDEARTEAVALLRNIYLIRSAAARIQRRSAEAMSGTSDASEIDIHQDRAP